MTASAAGMKKLAEAAEPLYRSLNDDQKRRLVMLARLGGHHHMGPTMMRHWRERTDFDGPDRDRPFGRERDRDDGPTSGPSGSEWPSLSQSLCSSGLAPENASSARCAWRGGRRDSCGDAC